MTYTADDFNNASFARRAGGCIAMRHGPYWVDSDDADFDHMLTHDDMAKSGWVPVQESRPLTPDDITDEMVERARIAWHDYMGTGDTMFRHVLTAALTGPPARPEGAEVWETWLSRLDYLHDETGASRADLATLANDLAAEIIGTPKEQS